MWFRQDLRVKDNPALNAACDMGKIIPIYIYDDQAPDGRKLGGASKWWLHHSLASLNERLSGHLQILKGDPKEILPALMEATGAKSIFWNRCYEPWQINRDKHIKKTLVEEEFIYELKGTLPTPKEDGFVGGETAALTHLDTYLFSWRSAATYKETRNALDTWRHSTKLSPWLAHGNISSLNSVRASFSINVMLG